MKLDDLVAIDVHAHAEVTSSPFEEASSKYRLRK
jgi:hypothetical protein